MSFNPVEYLGNRAPKPKNGHSLSLEGVISEIEEGSIDITYSHDEWVRVGFALVNEYGANGRDYFHRLSVFYTEYNFEDCDIQYNNCLKSKGSGVTIATLYYYAKKAGVSLSARNREETKPLLNFSEKMPPPIPFSIYESLPKLLEDSADLFEKPFQRDVFLVSVLSVLSGCLPNVRGLYFNEPLSAHLFSFISAPAGAGKGVMKWSKYFGQKIHVSKREDANKAKLLFQQEYLAYQALKKHEKAGQLPPEEPSDEKLFIPGNSSASAFLKTLQSNPDGGIIFETEADVLSNTFRQEWGSFSHLMRNAFHHETASISRNDEYFELNNLRLAIVLSGTPDQVARLLPSVEDGLFSRFLYYVFKSNLPFLNPFISYKNENYVDFFIRKGEQIFEIYSFLKRGSLKYMIMNILRLKGKNSLVFSMKCLQITNFYWEMILMLILSDLAL